ncbi:MAG: sugar ABC transporter permease, partial [Firmicutes bacterium]|nr:sugar ABC transporter permease [Bacillota bacterium]
MGPVRRRKSSKIRSLLEAYSFLAPAYMVFLVFIFVPVIWAFYLGMFDYSILSMRAPRFVGLRNYVSLLHDRIFHVALANTARYTLGTVPGKMTIGLIVALLLDQRALKAKNFFRTCYFLPVVTSMVAASIIWLLIFNAGEGGLANQFLRLFGSAPRGWLADSRYAMASVVIMSIWKDMGYCMLIYLAGLQGIPVEIYEASSIDGASPWQRLIHITLPLLKPTTFFILVTQLIGSFQVFTQTYVMTGGGPGYSTTTLINLLYTKG